MKIQGKSVLITGACSGIGKIMAGKCLEIGAAQVIIWDINEAAIAATVEELSAKGKVWGTKADISNPESVDTAYEATKAACGDVDIRLMQGIFPYRWFNFVFGDICGLYTVMNHFTGRK